MGVRGGRCTEVCSLSGMVFESTLRVGKDGGVIYSCSC